MSDQELLMEILEAREALDEADSEEEIESIRSSNRGWFIFLDVLIFLLRRFAQINMTAIDFCLYTAKAEETIRNIAVAFTAKDLVHAKDLCIQLRYWRNVEDASKDKMNPVD